MRQLLKAAAVAVILSAAACGGTKTDKDFTRADADVLRKTSTELAATYGAKDVDAAVALYSPDAVLMPPNAPTLRGKDAIRAYFTKRFAEGVVLHLEPQDVGGHGPIAFQSGTYSLTLGDRRDRGKFLFVSKLINNKWLFEQAMWSSDLPPTP